MARAGKITIDRNVRDDRSVAQRCNRNSTVGSSIVEWILSLADVARCIGRTKGGLNFKLHAACDEKGRPLVLLLSECQMSDDKGAAHMLRVLPKARTLLADKGYDADWFRAALAERKIEACISSRSNRKIPIPHDPVLYRKRHKIENMFGKLKDWRAFTPTTSLCTYLLLKHLHRGRCYLLAVNFMGLERSNELAVRFNAP